MSADEIKKQLQKLLVAKAELEEDLERLEKGTEESEEFLDIDSLNYEDRISGLAAVSQDLEIDMSIEEKVKLLLERVNKAIEDIDKGTYGVCKSCGGPITKERLAAIPYAERCINCQRKEEQR